MRKWRKLKLANDLMVQWLKCELDMNGVTQVGLPLDVKIVECSYDDRTISLVLESESFEPVAEGAEPPEMTVIYTREK